MDTILAILSILGAIGFVVSGYLAWLQLRSYYAPLRMYVTHVHCEQTDSDSALVLLRLAFVNPSSQSRTVCDLTVTDKTVGQHLVEVMEETNPSLQNVTYRLSNVSHRLPFAETLQLPLDIPQSQSLSRWKAIGISYQAFPDPHLGIPIVLEACTPMGKHGWKPTGDYGGVITDLKRRVLARYEYPVFPCLPVSRKVDIFREGDQ